MASDKVLINVNGKDYEVAAGQNVIDACASLGIEIPHFCYHPKLSLAGSCRMCLIQIGMPAVDRQTREIIHNEDGSIKIAWMPKPAIACGTKVCQNLHVITDSDVVKSCRQGALDFLLANHPLDCPICDAAGECKLQEYCNAYAKPSSRYFEEKNVKPKKTNIAGKIYLDNERCVLCSRCIRICREILGKDYLSFTKRGSKTCVAALNPESIDNNYIMNIVDNCPVGALTSIDFRFKMRPWFLKVSNSVSAESSAGTNIKVWSRENVIYRITPRRNDDVNDMWMSDSGRFEYKKTDAKFRLSCANLDGSDCESQYALNRICEIVKLGKCAIVASARQTFEEQFLVSKLAKEGKFDVYVPAHLGEDDHFLVSADRTPNMRGAFVSGLVKEYPKTDLLALREKVLAGEITSILSFDEDLLALGFSQKDLKSVNVIYCGTIKNELSSLAKITLPIANEFEKAGSYINRQWRIQKFDSVIEPKASVCNSISVVSALIQAVSGENFADITLADARRLIKDELGIDLNSVGENGMLLDSTKFASVKFPEERALHYDV